MREVRTGVETVNTHPSHVRDKPDRHTDASPGTTTGAGNLR